MGILSFLKRQGWSKRASPRPFEEVIARLDGGNWYTALAGEAVSLHTAIRVTAVLACAKVIADGCAVPKLHLYREKADGSRQIASTIPEYRLLARRPNEWQTSLEFRRTMTMHAALCGDALAIKVRAPGSNRVRELIPVVPGNFVIEEVARYQFVYRCFDKFGPIGTFGPEDVLHLSNIRWENVKSLDGINLAREAIGLSIAAERSQGTLYANGGRPSGLLSTPMKMSVDAIQSLRTAWSDFSSGNRNGTAILDNDFKFTPLSFNGVDQQHLEQRRMQVEEVARAFGVFPIMIGHADKTATYASAEAMFGAHLRHTVIPWQSMWTQRLDEFVLDGAGPLFVEFDNRYLARGSMVDQAKWAQTMISMKIMTRNEVRDEFGLDAVEGGDEFWSPGNIAGGSPPVDEGANDDAKAV